MELKGGRLCPGTLYPVDVSADDGVEGLWVTTNAYYSKLVQQRESSTEIFSISDEEKVKIEESSLSLLPLYQEDSKHNILVLVNPKDKATVLAVYVNNSWWGVEDVLKTSDPSREGVIEVRSFGERVVLFVLNRLVCGMLERRPSEERLTVFVPHPAEERAKILWQAGEAVGFYTIKRKGSLCSVSTSLCYFLPVLDTIFVRMKCRRRGLGTRMLQDFCHSFAAEDALGISCPISAAMYQVCQKFLQLYPEERERLWEVEAPGDWSQRDNIWLKIQLSQIQSFRHHDPRTSPKERDGHGTESARVGEPRHLESREGFNDLPNEKTTVQKRKETGDQGASEADSLEIQLKGEEKVLRDMSDAHVCKKLKKRNVRGGKKEDKVFDYAQSSSLTSYSKTNLGHANS